MTKKKRKPAESGGLKDADVGDTKRRHKKRAKQKKEIVTDESPVEQYVHPNEKRVNNPPVGLVDPNNDPDQQNKRYSYDPRLDPQLQWSGKTENSEFDVDTVSLHIHERIDPLTIIEKTVKEQKQVQQSLFHYFEMPENNPPLRDAIDFYKHEQNWSNRLISGDSLLVMNSFVEKEGMEGQVQMIYIDPPYGIKYGSNFQPFVNKTNVKDGKDEDLSQEPETIKAFRDTWELGIHSYLTYLLKRLRLAKKLLNESGSVFVQISDENVHLVRSLLEEVFGKKNFIGQIVFKKTGSMSGNYISGIFDTLIWFGKDIKKTKFRRLYVPRTREQINSGFSYIELENGNCRRLTTKELSGIEIVPKGRRFQTSPVMSSGESSEGSKPLTFQGKKFIPTKGRHWSIPIKELEIVGEKGFLFPIGNTMTFKKYLEKAPYTPLTNAWMDTMESTFAVVRYFTVQTAAKVIERCLLMTTDPGDLVLDPTCGSGTTVYAAEKFGRRWITCDTSRVAVSLTKQRLMTSIFKNYALAYPEEGISGGFKFKMVPHTTLKSIASNQPTVEDPIYDQPVEDGKKIRISGPFTIEAVPSPIVRSIDALSEEANQDTSQTKVSTQQEWRDELLRTGIRGKGGQKIEFSRVESHSATKWLHVDAETKEEKPKRVMVSFGPEHSPLEQRQVAKAIEESQTLVPKPNIIIFAAMQFDPEAAKDIDELKWPGVTILKCEMNKDMQTKDLKKKQSGNESFWLMGSPDVECKKQKDGKYIVTVNGFDYYNTKTNEIESGGASKIAMWELDTDYDDRSVYPQQVFFPMEGKSGGWEKLAKTLQAYIDEDLITKYQGIESIPFEAGPNKRVAVKIIDDRGIESLKIIDIE